ncbi:hypothetical protein ACFL3I_14245, partial [Pseudomonadota bacterium]
MIEIENIANALARANIQRSRLVFVNGRCDHLIDIEELSSINLNRALSEKLINVPRLDRAKLAIEITSELIADAAGDEVLL